MSHVEFERSSFDGTRLFFQEWQTDQGEKGVAYLIHGLGDNSGRYSHWGALMNQAGYSLLAFDLRGHGKSGGQRGHVSSYDDYLKDVDLMIIERRERHSGKPGFL